MNSSNKPNTHSRCQGPQNPLANGAFAGGLGRRSFMRFGLAGFANLSLPGMLKLRAASSAPRQERKKSVIMVWQPGG